MNLCTNIEIFPMHFHELGRDQNDGKDFFYGKSFLDPPSPVLISDGCQNECSLSQMTLFYACIKG